MAESDADYIVKDDAELYERRAAGAGFLTAIVQCVRAAARLAVEGTSDGRFAIYADGESLRSGYRTREEAEAFLRTLQMMASASG